MFNVLVRRDIHHIYPYNEVITVFLIRINHLCDQPHGSLSDNHRTTLHSDTIV